MGIGKVLLERKEQEKLLQAIERPKQRILPYKYYITTFKYLFHLHLRNCPLPLGLLMLTLALGHHMPDLHFVNQAACCVSGCVPGFWVSKPCFSGFQASCANGSLALKAVRTVASLVLLMLSSQAFIHS